MEFHKLINESFIFPLLLQTIFSHIKHAVLIKSTKNMRYVNNQFLYFLVYSRQYRLKLFKSKYRIW